MALSVQLDKERTFSIGFSRIGENGEEKNITTPSTYTLEAGKDSLSITLPPEVKEGDVVSCLVDGKVSGQPISVPAVDAGVIEPIEY